MISVIVVSKDEPALNRTLTLVGWAAAVHPEGCEVIVVDASEGRLDDVRTTHPEVRWIEFRPPDPPAVTIPHQRNLGVRAARGHVIVFTDAGCLPEPGWLDALAAPLLDGGESAVCGRTLGTDSSQRLYSREEAAGGEAGYAEECATINLAFTRTVFDAVGGFDEAFTYGSDVDFAWRLIASGVRIRRVPGAIVRHDWGSRRRQLRRSFAYGQARARLYRKHRGRLRTHAWRSDPLVFVYPLFLLGLPLAVVWPAYPALLLIPAWRNRSSGSLVAVVDHVWFGAGVLAELVSWVGGGNPGEGAGGGLGAGLQPEAPRPKCAR